MNHKTKSFAKPPDRENYEDTSAWHLIFITTISIILLIYYIYSLFSAIQKTLFVHLAMFIS